MLSSLFAVFAAAAATKNRALCRDSSRDFLPCRSCNLRGCAGHWLGWRARRR